MLYEFVALLLILITVAAVSSLGRTEGLYRSVWLLGTVLAALRFTDALWRPLVYELGNHQVTGDSGSAALTYLGVFLGFVILGVVVQRLFLPERLPTPDKLDSVGGSLVCAGSGFLMALGVVQSVSYMHFMDAHFSQTRSLAVAVLKYLGQSQLPGS